MEKFYYNSPIGILEITCENNYLTALKSVAKVKTSSNETDFYKRIRTQLDEYFSGKRKVFDIKITQNGTDFQKKVWKELLKIPYGETLSYSEIAQNIGNENASRAVGGACNKNPIMIVVPCHRVIAKNGNLTGFAYGLTMKEFLLNLEKSNN